MRPGSLTRLIQDRLDGVVTPEESARLDAQLERDDRARAAHARMDRLFRILREAEYLESPPDLAEDAVRVAERQAVADREHRGLEREGRSRLARLGFAFFVGALVGVLGVLGVSGLRSLQSPGAPVVGSMLHPASGARTIERQRVPFPGGEIVLESRRADGKLLIVANPGSVPLSRIVLEHDPATLRWIGLESSGAAMAPGTVAWTPGTVTLEPQGPGPYVLWFAAGDHAPSVGITLLAEGRIQRASLRTSETDPPEGR